MGGSPTRRAVLALGAGLLGSGAAARAGGSREGDGMSLYKDSYDRARQAERRLADYMAAFNRSDYDALTGFYAEDVVLVIGNGTELRGRQAIVDFYRVVKANTQRTIKILRSFPGEEGIAAELESEFLATADVPDFTSGPMKKGDRLYINSFVIYRTRGELYANIRSAVFKREWRRA